MVPLSDVNGPDTAMCRQNGSQVSGQGQTEVSVLHETELQKPCDHTLVSVSKKDFTLHATNVANISGAYIKGCVNDVPMVCSLDDKTTVTIVSKDIYGKIENKPKLISVKGKHITCGKGRPLKVYGAAMLKLHFGSLEIDHCAYIADIAYDCLLGADILMFSDLGPTDINICEKNVVLGGNEIPFESLGTVKIGEISVKESHGTSPCSELGIVCMDKCSECNDRNNVSSKLCEASPITLKVAPKVVAQLSDVNSHGTCSKEMNLRSEIQASVNVCPDPVKSEGNDPYSITFSNQMWYVRCENVGMLAICPYSGKFHIVGNVCILMKWLHYFKEVIDEVARWLVRIAPKPLSIEFSKGQSHGSENSMQPGEYDVHGKLYRTLTKGSFFSVRVSAESEVQVLNHVQLFMYSLACKSVDMLDDMFVAYKLGQSDDGRIRPKLSK